METKVIIEVLAASVRIATPLLFAALGGLLSESAGTFAVGIEGMMLMAAERPPFQSFLLGPSTVFWVAV